MRWFVPRHIRHDRDDSGMDRNEDVPDLDDDRLPADDIPPEAQDFLVADPEKIPPDEGDFDAERKEDTDG